MAPTNSRVSIQLKKQQQLIWYLFFDPEDLPDFHLMFEKCPAETFSKFICDTVSHCCGSWFPELLNADANQGRSALIESYTAFRQWLRTTALCNSSLPGGRFWLET